MSTHSQPTLTSLPSRLNAIHSRVWQTGLYLGDRSIRDNVEWIKHRKAKRLVMKRSADDDVENPRTAPEVVSLIAIVRISDEDFWMLSDGGYRGPGLFNLKFADVKPSCSGGVPDVEPFKSDFTEVIENLRWLMDDISTPDVGKRGCIVGPVGFPRVKVRHILFERKLEGFDNDNDEPVIGENIDKDDFIHTLFDIKSWPVEQEAAQAGLAEITETHTVNPVPAYDVNGDLINPRHYRSRLEGATVELHFELAHWHMFDKHHELDHNRFCADVTFIRVVVPPSSQVSSPRKRKLHHKIDPMESPTKKNRAN